MRAAHRGGRDDAAARSHGPGIAGHRIERLVERPARQALDDGAGAAEIDLAFLQRQVEAAGEWLVAPDGLAQCARHLVAEMNGHGLALGLHRNVRRLQDGVEEAGDILAAADGGAHALQLGGDGLGAQGVLGEARAAGLLAVAGVLPFGMDGLLLWLRGRR